MGFLVIVYTGSEASMPKVFIENVEEKLTKRCKQLGVLVETQMPIMLLELKFK
jgi:hypothetical protein